MTVERRVPRHPYDHPARVHVDGEEASEGIQRATGHSLAATTAELAEYAAEDEVIAATPVEVPLERLWEPRLKLYRQNRMWLPEWGERPGQPGCACPEWLLR